MIIPFHALPIYKESSDFRLNKDEMESVVGGEFRKTLSNKGNVISKQPSMLPSLGFTPQATLSARNVSGNIGSFITGRYFRFAIYDSALSSENASYIFKFTYIVL